MVVSLRDLLLSAVVYGGVAAGVVTVGSYLLTNSGWFGVFAAAAGTVAVAIGVNRVLGGPAAGAAETETSAIGDIAAGGLPGVAPATQPGVRLASFGLGLVVWGIGVLAVAL